jgi:Ser/Thr protein kinase RdoA (MazF antagonist)
VQDNERMATPADDNLLAILAHWFPPAELPRLQLEKLPGGLSGALLWKVTTLQESWCLRRTPLEHAPLPWRHRKIHEFSAHIWQAGFRNIPLPKRVLSGESCVQKQGGIWELTNWLIGNTTQTPTLEQAKAAAAALARFHLAGESFHKLQGCPSGLQDRLVFLDELYRGDLRVLKSAVDRALATETRASALRIMASIESALPQAIEAVERSCKKVPIQWCLIDPHIGNFLFINDSVTGIVDFAIAGASSVARDVARLVGSVVPHLDAPWRECVAAYQRHRPLSADEIRLVFAFHISGTVGAAANWLRWRFIDNLSAADAATTQTRLADLAARLELLPEAELALSANYGPIA